MSKNNEKHQGIIIGIQGPVVNVRFEKDTPLVNEALELELSDNQKLILETALIMATMRLKLWQWDQPMDFQEE